MLVLFIPPIEFSTFGIMHKFASIISQLNNIWVGSSMQDTHEPRSWTVLTFPWNTRVHQTPHIALAAYFWGYHAFWCRTQCVRTQGSHAADCLSDYMHDDSREPSSCIIVGSNIRYHSMKQCRILRENLNKLPAEAIHTRGKVLSK